MIREKITDFDMPLDEGDIVEMHFNAIGLQWITAAQITLIEWQLKGHPHFEILAWSIFDPSTVVFKCMVKKSNPIPVISVAIIAAAIIGAGIVFKLTLDSAYKLINVPAETLKSPGIQAIAGGVIIIIIGYIVLRFLGK